ncbi:MAG: PfkB family carbohydrate kinase [Pseudomonadota bacterium]
MPGPLQIIGFGALSIDDIVYVDRPLTAGKGRVIDRLTDHGGNVATALVAAATLGGGGAGFIGWLRDITPEDIAASELASHGVDISFAPRRPDARAIRSAITVGSDGERFIAYDDVVPHGTDDTLPDAVLAQAKVLLIDGYATHSPGVVARARRLGLAIVADIEWSLGAATETLLSLSDHLVLPYAFGQSQTGADDPSAILRALWAPGRAAVILTRGEHGSYVRQAGDSTLWHLPAHRVQAVDTTGAGDCFHGAYAYALAQGQSALDSAVFANAAAAISVSGHGGRKALPGLAACQARLAGAGAPRPTSFGVL